MEQLKTCIRCKNEFPVALFVKNYKIPDGLYSFCKQCNNKRRSQVLKANPIKTKADQRLRWLFNPDKLRAAKLKWKKANLEAHIKSRRTSEEKSRKTLSDAYIKGLLRQDSPYLSRIPQELIEAKREIIRSIRIIRTLKEKA